MSHAYIAPSRWGTDLDRYGRELAVEILCSDERDACRERVRNSVHPDLRFLRPEKSKISIDEIRQINKDVFLSPVEGNRKVYVIDKGEDLSLPAANSLLKVLESPPSYVHFLLMAFDLANLPDTVISRCQKLPIGGLSRDELIDYLRKEGFSSREAGYLLKTVNGRGDMVDEVIDKHDSPLESREEVLSSYDGNTPVEVADDLAGSDDYIRTHELTRLLLEDLPEMSDFEIVKTSEILGKLSRSKLSFILYKMVGLCRDVMVVPFRKDLDYGDDELVSVEKVKAGVVLDLNRAVGNLEKNANRRLLLENVFFEVRGTSSDRA